MPELDNEYFTKLFQELQDENYKEIKSRAQPVQGNKDKSSNLESRLLGINSRGHLLFKTRSASIRGKWWNQEIRLDGLRLLIKRNPKKKPIQIVREAIQGDLMIYCDCISGETRVKTKSGYSLIKDIKRGDYVLSDVGEWVFVEGLIKSNEKKKQVSLEISGEVKPLILSGDHKVKVSTYRDMCACGCNKNLRPIKDETAIRNSRTLLNRKFIPKHGKREERDNFNRFQWKRVSEMKPGDLLITPIVKSGIKPLGDVNLARMLGYYLSEGHTPKGCRFIVITLNQNERNTIAKDITDYFTGLGVEVKLEDHFYKDQKWLTVNIYSEEFKNACLYFCGEKSKEKKLSYEVFDWTREEKESLLLGHFLGDGFLIEDHSCRWLTTSIDLAEDLQILLMSIRVYASVGFGNKEREGHANCYRVGAAPQAFQEVLIKYNNLFRREINFPKKKWEKYKSSITKNYMLRSVKKVELDSEEEMYDIVLSDSRHSFLANNVVVSNCPKFKYWGHQFIAWKHDFGLRREKRFPKKRNPGQEGGACHHLTAAMTTLPFHSTSLVKMFRAKSKQVLTRSKPIFRWFRKTVNDSGEIEKPYRAHNSQRTSIGI
jgi:intein/homing endonuclease